MTPQLIPNMMSGDAGQVSKGMQAQGIQPIGNGGGSNLPGPTAMAQVASTPGAVPLAAANPIVQNSVGGAPVGVVPAQAPVTTPNTLTPGGPVGTIPGAVQGQLDSQLTDVFGKGVGGAIDSTIANLGSTNSTYMQAYQAAMAQPNAEALATLQTAQGNAGISANSSAAAIGTADLLSSETAQEGLQEQQLQQTDQQDLIGLLTSTEGAANKEASTSVWGDIGSVLGAVGSDAATAAGAISKIL